MVFVLTVDQIGSRHHPDRIPELAGAPWADRARLPFTRTAGDEAQAVFDRAQAAVRCAVELALTGRWHCGIGQGPARIPAGQRDSRAGRGPAFLRARTAVEQAKADPSHLGFQGGPGDVAAVVPDPDAPERGRLTRSHRSWPPSCRPSCAWSCGCGPGSARPLGRPTT